MPGREKKSGKHAKGHNPLGEDLHADKFVVQERKKKRELGGSGFAGDDDIQLSAKSAKKVFQLAKKDLVEEFDEEGDSQSGNSDDMNEKLMAPQEAVKHKGKAALEEGEEESEEEGEEEESEVELEYDDQESQVTEDQNFAELEGEFNIDDEESRLLEKFQPSRPMQNRNLADIIMNKIKEKEIQKKESGEAEEVASEEQSELGLSKIDKRVAKVYRAIGAVLKRYSSGKIPKAFKVLPHVQNWEQLLILTSPHEWSPHATYAATRIFAAGLNEKMAQRFYSAILMPVVHTAMEENKKLHPSLYMAIRKALFKPLAFFKGFLLPLCLEGECTMREALVIGSVLQKCHLPPIPTAVSLVKISQLPFSSASTVFLRVLIDKKMALPMQCVDALVSYFHRFIATHGADDPLPVLWHQTLLLFVTYYRHDLNPAQIDLLKDVCTKHFHHLITPEIRREIAAAQGKKSQYD